MDADTYTPKALFKKDICYEIPTFQRPYVWNQEDQWEPLWDDVRNVAERYLENFDYHGRNPTAAQRATSPHFLGAVVLQQQPNAIADLETRDVIDGQQRMTTLQIMIDAAQEVFVHLAARGEAKRLLALVENQLIEDEQDKWKLRPTALDREAFVAAMTNDPTPVGFEDSRIVQAHDFFRLQVEEWLVDRGPDSVNDRCHALETALMGLLSVVAIELEATDDSFVIFETLNARGTPLNQSDLVKNFILQRATQASIDADALHANTWQALEIPYWREEITQGRIRRRRLDQFLNYWLAMRTGSDVAANSVFPAFKRLVDRNGEPVDQAARAVRRSAERLTALEQSSHPRVDSFNYRMRTMQVGTVTPLLIWLATNHDLDNPGLVSACEIIEDFLVRRMVCRGTTKDYNKLFLDAVQHLDGAPRDADPSLVLGSFLAGQTAESRTWPDDLRVESALLDLPLYRLLTRGRLRFVLEAIEEERRRGLSEVQTIPRGTLTIEHLLPQSWSKNWPPPVGEDMSEALRTRDRLIHTVGNLTLLTTKMNAKLSNDPWPKKVKSLKQHSTLLITGDLLETWGASAWDEETIQQRGAALSVYFGRVWPGPSKWGRGESG